MPDSTSLPTVKRSTWRRKLLFLAAALLLLLVAAYFIVTSSAFFKGVILPRAGNAMGGRLTVTDSSISPFSQVHLTQFKLQTTGPEPLLQAEEIRLRYSLVSILRGTMKFDEVTIVSPVFQIVVDPDGASNLDPLLKKDQKPAAKSAASASPS